MHKLHFLASLAALGVALAGPTRTAIGQDRPDSMMVARVTPRWTTGSISFQLGSAHLGLSELNGTLAANDRPAFSSDVATLGLSAYARFGRLTIGGTGESALPQRAASPGWRNRIAFASATLDAGVALIDRPRLLVQTQLSFGVRKTSLHLEQSDDFQYDDGVRDPARGVELSSLSALGGVGLVAELRFATRTTGAFAIGLRAGVSRPLGHPATLAGERTVTGAPRESAGSYLRLSIGKPIARRREIMSALSTAMLSIITL